MSAQADHLSRHAVARYLVALGAVVAALALRLLLTPLTGRGAPFVLFFAAVLVTSLYVGAGPGLVALVASYLGFTTRRGTEGVGDASTRAVVMASVLIILSDVILVKLIFFFYPTVLG